MNLTVEFPPGTEELLPLCLAARAARCRLITRYGRGYPPLNPHNASGEEEVAQF